MAEGNTIDSYFRNSITEKSYSFKWTIENFSKLKVGEELRSPEFRPELDIPWYAKLKKQCWNANGHNMYLSFFTTSSQTDFTVTGKTFNIDGDLFGDCVISKLQKADEFAKFQFYFYGAKTSSCYDVKYFPKDTLIFVCNMKFGNYLNRTDGYNRISENSLVSELNILSNELKKLRMQSIHTDVILKVRERSFLAHKGILSVRSEVFSKMFVSDMKEKNSNTIEICDIEPNIFEMLLEYIYTGTFPQVDFDSAQALYLAADMYCILNLKRLIGDYLFSELKPENAVRLLYFAFCCNDAELQENVSAFIKVHKEECNILEFIHKIIDEKDTSGFLEIVKAL